MTPNQRKRALALSHALLKHLAIALHSDDKRAIIIDLRHMRRIETLTNTDLNVLLDLEHPWRVMTSVFLKIGSEMTTKTHQHNLTERYKQNELVEYLHDYHLKQYKDERADHAAGFAWIALPVPRELSVQQIDVIYELVKKEGAL